MLEVRDDGASHRIAVMAGSGVALARALRGSEAPQPHDGRIKGRDVRLWAVVVFQGVMASWRDVRLIGAACGTAAIPQENQLPLCAMCGIPTMSGEDDFRIRPGRIRSTRAQQARPFIAQALAAAQKAGGTVSRKGKIGPANRSRFGRGQRAAVQANRMLSARSRGAVIKARVVRQGGRSAPLGTHRNYLRRDGVTRDGEKARLFGPGGDDADPKAFAERCEEDRHHFRFIVSPDDALEMSDLKSFTRELVGQMEKDLGTRLDWVAVDHWNTEHPHVHLIVRGVRDDGENLVISRDYIKEGMRDRARDLITQELGPRTDQEIRRTLERQVEAERWTNLDRQLARDAHRTGIVDLAPHADRQPDEFHALKVGRLRKLEIARARRPDRARPMGDRRQGRGDASRARRTRRHHQAHASRVDRPGYRAGRRELCARRREPERSRRRPAGRRAGSTTS